MIKDLLPGIKRWLFSITTISGYDHKVLHTFCTFTKFNHLSYLDPYELNGDTHTLIWIAMCNNYIINNQNISDLTYSSYEGRLRKS